LTDIALPVKIGIFSAAPGAASLMTQKRPVPDLFGSGFTVNIAVLKSE
jgi:hypothetical protein